MNANSRWQKSERNYGYGIIDEEGRQVLLCASESMADRLIRDHNEGLDRRMAVVSEVNVALGKLIDPTQHYVVVASDGPCVPREGWLDYHSSLTGRVHGEEFGHTDSPLVWETVLGHGTTLDAARGRAKSIKGTNGGGKVRIARLEFLPEEA